jgi:hypothetical protein
MAAEARRWALSLVLLAPASIPYLTHVLIRKPYSLPTGYIQPDMPVYMAKAREYFDPGAFRPAYSNPCSDSYDEPRIYFQPWTLALGLVHHYGGLRPGALFVAFWFLAAWACARAALALYQEVVGLDSPARRRGLVVFFWGGGLLTLAGVLRGLATRGAVTGGDLVALDPFEGWWFLNFGRNLIYPTESLYHALFFLCILCAIRRRHVAATFCALLTAASTPFTGLELLAILWAWGFVEVVYLEDPEGRRGLFVAITVSLALFLAYYLGFLNLFPEHRLLSSQMALAWGYSARTIIPAYALVGSLAAWRLRRYRLAAAVLGESRGRLFLAWAAAAFALAKHEHFARPRQPIHFTRGYVWTALFFLGAPALVALLDRLGRLRRPWGRVATASVLALFLSDNIAWFARHAANARLPGRNGVRLTAEKREVLDRLDTRSYYGDLLISDDPVIRELAIAETPLRSWVSHWLETPHLRARAAQVEALFRDGRFAREWESRPLLIVVTRRSADEPPPAWLAGRRAARVFQNRRFAIYRVVPAAPSRAKPPGMPP